VVSSPADLSAYVRRDVKAPGQVAPTDTAEEARFSCGSPLL
jgi:hypothetical protein